MKKILFVGEFSQIATGYGRITKELITRFHNDGYEVAELACFCSKSDKRIEKCPWKIYTNMPTTEEENSVYSSNAQNSNGKWKFEEVLIDFKPDCVFGNGDPFMYEYQMHSPFREFFNWVVMAPVDGLPQHNQWIQIFENADGLCAYTNWGKKVLEDYNIKVDAIIPPVASDGCFEINKEQKEIFKKKLNIQGKTIIGNIMRNQPRKLFNELFESFAEYNKEDNKSMLYCHTTYPDAGWDLSELLIKHKILNKTMFTYKCFSCSNIFPSYFQDILTVCPFCKKNSARMPSGQNSVDEQTLNKIINLFDVYVQLASREGFGIPQIEAAACNVPVVTINYAGMSDMRRSIGAFMVEPVGFYNSYPMNMMEAVIDKKEVVKKIHEAKNSVKPVSTLYKENYKSWDSSYYDFKNIIDSLKPKTWNSKKIKPVEPYEEITVSNEDYAKYLIAVILDKPELIGSYLQTRLIRDLNSGITFGGTFGNYFTENIGQDNPHDFDRKRAYSIFYNQRMFNDFWFSELNKTIEKKL
jgi:glycosyltransferase involved in cell wall biosynthesis